MKPLAAAAGAVRALVPCPHQHASGVLTVSMVNEHGQYFEDQIAVTFNEGFRTILGWAALLPFLLTVATVFASSIAPRTALPL